jgi:hypothetical protein
MHTTRILLATVLVTTSTVLVARADRQRIAPGTALQSEVVVNTGANGVCETAAGGDDIQAAAVGLGTPAEDEIRCGQDQIVSTIAAGDDTQLVPLNGECQNRNTVIIDTGPDGIANTTAAGDDASVLAVGTAAPNTACVLTGANGLADTADPVGGDDARQVPVGTALPNAVVVRCGVNELAETRANNVNSAGDDVQLIQPGAGCPLANSPVVDSGANGIADTRAEGSDLLLRLKQTTPISLTIKRKKGTVSKTVKVAMSNVEFGSTAPQARTALLVVRDNDCPRGTVSAVDANTGIAGPQQSADIPLGKQVKGSFVVTFGLEDVTSVDKKIPFRCEVRAEVQSLDTAPVGDDATNPQSTEARVAIEVVDEGDLKNKK